MDLPFNAANLVVIVVIQLCQSSLPLAMDLPAVTTDVDVLVPVMDPPVVVATTNVLWTFQLSTIFYPKSSPNLARV